MEAISTRFPNPNDIQVGPSGALDRGPSRVQSFKNSIWENGSREAEALSLEAAAHLIETSFKDLETI